MSRLADLLHKARTTRFSALHAMAKITKAMVEVLEIMLSHYFNEPLLKNIYNKAFKINLRPRITGKIKVIGSTTFRLRLKAFSYPRGQHILRCLAELSELISMRSVHAITNLPLSS